MSNSPLDRGVCDQRKGDHPDPMKRICNRPAMFRYPAMGGGYACLCEIHGAVHQRYSERWDGSQWVQP